MERIKAIILIVMGACNLWPAMALVTKKGFWNKIFKAFGNNVDIWNCVNVIGFTLFVMGCGLIALGIIKYIKDN